MQLPTRSQRPRRGIRRRGLSLVELLSAIAIMTLMAGALGMLAITLQTSNEAARSKATVVQHARVVVARIERACEAAHAVETFPAFRVVAESEGGWDFPDVLVVWTPTGSTSGQSLPRFDQLTIFAPNPAQPNELLEITLPADPRTVPAYADEAGWQAELYTILVNDQGERVTLTDTLSLGQAPTTSRARLRFQAMHRPSDADLAEFRDGLTTWDALPWVRDIYTDQAGMRQAWCRIEMQLSEYDVNGPVSEPIPFFGSSAVYYQVRP